MLLTSMLALVIGCGNAGLLNAQAKPLVGSFSDQNTEQAAQQDESTAKLAQAPVIYESFRLQGAKSIAALKSKLGEEGFAVVLKLNRLDRGHVRSGEILIVPSEVNLMRLAPFPLELEFARGIEKLILVSRRIQAFGAYESGRLVHWGPTSTGKRATETPAGIYYTNWKSKETHSTVNPSWVLPWYFNLDNFAGVGFHQYDLPGYPASHGCVRLLNEDAKWIFDWADQWILAKGRNSVAAYGTPVIIFGDYAYGRQAPWKRLAEDAHASDVTASEIEAALNPHLPAIEARLRERQSVIAAATQTTAATVSANIR